MQRLVCKAEALRVTLVFECAEVDGDLFAGPDVAAGVESIAALHGGRSRGVVSDVPADGHLVPVRGGMEAARIRNAVGL